MKGYVIFDDSQAADLTQFFAKADGGEFTPVNRIKCESISLIGGGKTCFNVEKAAQILHRPITDKEIATTLSHIECWHKIVDNPDIAESEFAIVAEAELELLPNYYTALMEKTQYFHSLSRDLILLSRSAQDDHWMHQLYAGAGELNAICFSPVSFYDNAHCQMYLIRKSFARQLVAQLSATKPFWLAHHFSQFCRDEQLSQINLFVAKPKEWPFIVVKTVDDTLDFVLHHSCSIMRFGDGEFDIMRGCSIAYQNYHPQLAETLTSIVQTASSAQKLICVPDIFGSLSAYNDFATRFWQAHLGKYRTFYESVCTAPWYGCTFISRPYIDWQDKSHSARWFQKLKQLWQDKDILIVEGETSRSGVGNDLFDNAKSIQRIICPSKNAYDKVVEIKQAIEKYAENRLILIMLGPTAKVLAWNLSELGYRAIDIGHIDSEYEWFKMGATEKVKLGHKHTAEFNNDNNISFVVDEKYEKQIIARVI